MNTTTAPSTVTVEELKMFHTIDREMYCKLVFSLHHNPLLAIRIMAFWLWLEMTRSCSNIILRLHSISSVALNTFALETITCIYCLDDEILALSIMSIGIPCLRYVLKDDSFSIPYLMENRVAVLQSMQKVSDSVCTRAFNDLVTSQLLSQRLQFQTLGSVFNSGSSSSTQSMIVPRAAGVQGSTSASGVTRPVVVGPRRNNNYKCKQAISYEEEENTHGNISASIVDEQMNERTVADSASRISTQHERTVFLTFSKGYPVTETQLRDFFVGRFGDIIEDIIMPEVPPGEQVLYARMLVHSSNEVDMVLGRQNRVKFTINEKYVYARKYVKRNPARAIKIE